MNRTVPHGIVYGPTEQQSVATVGARLCRCHRHVSHKSVEKISGCLIGCFIPTAHKMVDLARMPLTLCSLAKVYSSMLDPVLRVVGAIYPHASETNCPHLPVLVTYIAPACSNGAFCRDCTRISRCADRKCQRQVWRGCAKALGTGG